MDGAVQQAAGVLLAVAQAGIVLPWELAVVARRLNHHQALLLALHTLLLLVQAAPAVEEMEHKDQIQFLAPLPRPAAVMAVVITGQQEQMVAQVGQAVAAVA